MTVIWYFATLWCVNLLTLCYCLFILCVFFVYFSFLPCDDESSYINKNISTAIKSWTACRDNTNKSFAEGKSISLSEGSVASPQGGVSAGWSECSNRISGANLLSVYLVCLRYDRGTDDGRTDVGNQCILTLNPLWPLGNANPGVIFQTRVYGFDGIQTRVPGYPGLIMVAHLSVADSQIVYYK